jgi:hypothetical protein
MVTRSPPKNLGKAKNSDALIYRVTRADPGCTYFFDPVYRSPFPILGKSGRWVQWGYRWLHLYEKDEIAAFVARLRRHGNFVHHVPTAYRFTLLKHPALPFFVDERE